MLTRKEFVSFILDGPGAPRPRARMRPKGPALPGPFGEHGFATEEAEVAPADTTSSFAVRLIEAAFDRQPPQYIERAEVILGEDPAARSLPDKVYYWPKTGSRPYQTLLFELEASGLELLDDHLFHQERRQRQLEDALHRLVQYTLQGFAKGGERRTAATKRGAPDKTLCVVSIRDDRQKTDAPTQLVCLGTHVRATNALEVFDIREEAKTWERQLAEEHLGQLYDRHFKRLDGEKWQDAFITGDERRRARELLEVCTRAVPDEKQIRTAVVSLLEEIARTFGLRQRRDTGTRLRRDALPADHDIGIDPADLEARGYHNPFSGMALRDEDERLLGYIIYCLDEKQDAAKLREHLRERNVFHNVLVIYPDGDEAALELWQGRTRLEGRLRKSGATFEGEGRVVTLLSRFFVVSKSPISTPRDLAMELAERAKYLRRLALHELREEQRRKSGKRPVLDLYQTFDQALARQTEEEFADAYAQALTYGLLAARWMSRGKNKRFTTRNVGELLPTTSPFLADLFKRLIELRIAPKLMWLIDDLVSLLDRTAVKDVFGADEAADGFKDPVIHFYEDFLDAYDPQIRRDRGVYYTPDEVVSYIVRTTDSALREQFGLELGLADTTTWGEFARRRKLPVPQGVDPSEPFVQILDPALGTGTFLKHVIELVHETMTARWRRAGFGEARIRREWSGYVREHLLPRINGFEVMMAPYVVAHLRLGLLLEESGFEFSEGDRLRVFLTNTLEQSTSSQLDWLGEHVAEESREADAVKNETPISVIIGNPPYDREPNDPEAEHKGGWVRDNWSRWRGDRAPLEDYLELARQVGAGGHLKNIYNLYVYFWRWATWKVFDITAAPGIVSFITASSYLRGPGFVGMRKHMRRSADEIYLLDLEGDQRGTRITANVFWITIPVVVASLVRSGRGDASRPAESRYHRVVGSREQKLALCKKTAAFSEVSWAGISDSWHAPFIGSNETRSGYDEWPKITDLFPWHHSGPQFKRTWPIDACRQTLRKRWEALLDDEDCDVRSELFKETRDRKISRSYPVLLGGGRASSIGSEPRTAAPPPVLRYGFRSFDRQWCLADSRLGDRIDTNIVRI